mgnify:CR=1 FL=1
MDIKVGVQALYYISEKLNHPVDKITAIKLIYFADRYHLRKYGRLITGDVYYAMKYGTVASNIKDILSNNICNEEGKGYIEQCIKKIDDKTYESVKSDIQLKSLSKTDIEALDFVIKKLGSLTSWELSELSHKYPEWKRFENTLSDDNKREPVVIDDFFSDYTFDGDVFQIIPQEIVEQSREIYFFG